MNNWIIFAILIVATILGHANCKIDAMNKAFNSKLSDLEDRQDRLLDFIKPVIHNQEAFLLNQFKLSDDLRTMAVEVKKLKDEDVYINSIVKPTVGALQVQ